LHPVSRIRVGLEKVRILDDHDPWLKGRGDFQFTTRVAFNHDSCRRYHARVPQKGVLKISDSPRRNERELNVCVFDGFVAESDRMEFSILPVEKDWLDPDDQLTRYYRYFGNAPENWVGSYRPDDESGSDPEHKADWEVWYRVESLPSMPEHEARRAISPRFAVRESRRNSHGRPQLDARQPGDEPSW
jgi:hypothetical protein